MLKAALKEFCAELGFARTHICALPDYTHWRAQAQAQRHPALNGLTDDARCVFGGDCIAVLLAWPYRPYEDAADGATVSAYYPASDEANRRAADAAQWLEQRGFRALCHPNIPLKPMAVQSGLAKFGRNGVTAIDEMGSRFALQAVLTDAPLETDPGSGGAFDLSESCLHCGKCVSACPVGALDGTGRVDIHRCIRAKSDEYPLEEKYRPLIGRRLYGCDICQDVCPRNAGIGTQPTPDALREALRLENLLRGEAAALAPFIGKNYARKARMQAKACVIAANMGRTDLREEIRACKDSPVEFVRVHAEWAENQLGK